MAAAAARQMTFLAAVEAAAPKRPAAPAALTALSGQVADDCLPAPTHAQVYYWRELAGAITLRGTVGMPDDGWPAELQPSKQTLTHLVARRLVVRRGRAWHLRRHWYARLQALRERAVETPALVTAERPAPDLPTYVEIKAMEALCLYLDTQPRSRARLPFTGWAVHRKVPAAVPDAAAAALGNDAGVASGPDGSDADEGDLPVTLLKRLHHYRLVRHITGCAWALSPTWRERLQLLWRGVRVALREYTPPQPTQAAPQSLAAGIDTWHLNWVVSEPLPSALRERLEVWQQRAREEESEIETELLYDSAPLRMYRWGTKAERTARGGGVSWGYVLLNASLRLLIRKAPLGGIIAQARLGSECLWRRTPRGALDELSRLMRRLWRGQEGTWQVSQVHLCHDVVNMPIDQDLLSRVVSRSRTQALYEAAQADVERARRQMDGNVCDEDDLPLDFGGIEGIDWEAEYADDDPLSAFSLVAFDVARSTSPEAPIEERATVVYRWGRRLSGVTFAPGGPTSFAMYLKTLEARLRGKLHMFSVWQAQGWDGVAEVTRCEARLRRAAIHELRLPLPPKRVATAQDPAVTGAAGQAGEQLVNLDDPYVMLEHLGELFASVVGRLDDCPDAVNTAWIRVVSPQEGDTNRSRWDTDPRWRVVQAARFADAPLAARRLIRRKQRAHDLQRLVCTLYGCLVSFTATEHPQGEQWDVSRAIGVVAQSLVTESERPKKDFGELVRQRRKARGLAVLPREPALPGIPPYRQRTADPPITADEADAAAARHDADLAARLRAKGAEFRVRQAFAALEDAERSGQDATMLEALEQAYLVELATCAAAWASVQTHNDSRKAVADGN